MTHSVQSTETVTDPGFPRGGAKRRGGVPIYYFKAVEEKSLDIVGNNRQIYHPD